jgi:hypothetical protein
VAFDYTDIAAVAKELIEDFGRTLTIRKIDTAPTDSSKPWRGQGTSHTSITPIGVILDYEAKDIDGEIIRGRDRLAYIAATSTEVGSNDLSTFDEVVDETITYRIIQVERLKPGGTVLLYTMQLRSMGDS